MRLRIFQRTDRYDPGGARLAGGATLNDRRRSRALIALVVVLGLAMLAFLALAFLFSRPAIVVDSSALAQVQMPVTGGTRESVTATGPGGRTIPIAISDGQLWPQVKLAPGETVSVEVVVRRAGWVAWLAGSQTHATPDVAHAERARERPLRHARSRVAAATFFRSARAHARVRAARTPAPRHVQARAQRDHARPRRPGRVDGSGGGAAHVGAAAGAAVGELVSHGRPRRARW